MQHKKQCYSNLQRHLMLFFGAVMKEGKPICILEVHILYAMHMKF